QIQAKKAEVQRDLEVMKERLALALYNSKDGIFDWDLRRNTLYWSVEYQHMLGHEPPELESSIETFKSLLHPEDEKEVWNKFDECIRGDATEYSHIFRMRHKAGHYIWVHAKGKPIFQDGQPVRFIGAHSDVTALKETELLLMREREKAETANLAKSSFLAHMSHEIRTPLTAITGVAEIFERNLDQFDEKQKRLVKTLHRSASILRELISDILDFSKIESGELELEKQVFLLDNLFEEVISMMNLQAQDKNIGFILDYKEVRGQSFYGDPLRLRQILINLVGNAIKFTNEGSVTIKAHIEMRENADHQLQSWLRIDVQDTGIGIANENHELIFEHFKQADSSVSRRFGGTGLGLPISRNLARMMQGDIAVTSVPGQGSTFSLHLPMQAQSKNTALSGKLSMSGPYKILVVEDNEGNIAVITYILEEMGLVYDVVRSGRQALHKLQDGNYSLILMDIQMPEMDGFTATSEIRRREREQGLPSLPVIGMTAHALVAGPEQWQAAGMNACLHKPILQPQLRDYIFSALSAAPNAALHERSA
ncbi:MAG: ATP-binding protein, partial [Alphaproteobacteria bacterium]|nr:ATP-binding protein [Alphaproteobacteria bacterium]